MATHSLHKNEQPQDWPAGVPRHGLGAARNELLAIGLAIATLALIAIAFYIQATP